MQGFVLELGRSEIGDSADQGPCLIGVVYGADCAGELCRSADGLSVIRAVLCLRLRGIQIHHATDEVQAFACLSCKAPLKSRVLLLSVIRTVLSVGTLNINVICLANPEDTQRIDEVTLFNLDADLILLCLRRREHIALVLVGGAGNERARVERLAVTDVGHDFRGELIAQGVGRAGCTRILACLPNSRIARLMTVQSEGQLQAVIHELHRVYDVIACHLLLELQRRLIVGQWNAWPGVAAVEIARAGPEIAAARVAVDPVLIDTDDVLVVDLPRAEVAAQSCTEIDARMTERPILGAD